MTCKCGNQSKGSDLVKYYKRKDGTMVTYIQKERRCQECINKSIYKILKTKNHERTNIDGY